MHNKILGKNDDGNGAICIPTCPHHQHQRLAGSDQVLLSTTIIIIIIFIIIILSSSGQVMLSRVTTARSALITTWPCWELPTADLLNITICPPPLPPSWTQATIAWVEDCPPIRKVSPPAHHCLFWCYQNIYNWKTCCRNPVGRLGVKPSHCEDNWSLNARLWDGLLAWDSEIAAAGGEIVVGSLCMGHHCLTSELSGTHHHFFGGSSHHGPAVPYCPLWLFITTHHHQHVFASEKVGSGWIS